MSSHVPGQGSGAAGAESPGRPAPTPQPAPGLDLSSCDREPIHVPGSIQPHGFLLALDPQSLAVREASSNAAAYLCLPIAAIFGQSLRTLLGTVQGERLHADLAPFAEASSGSGQGVPLATPRMLSSVALDQAGNKPIAHFDVVAHRTPGAANACRILVEFELIREPVDLEALQARLYNFVSANRGKQTAEAVMEAAVSELRVLTGCDRVVLYSFDEEGHGLVLAENRGEQFDSYLGLRFPASDVPKQARRMYELNRVRIIPDVDYQPSPLIPAQGSAGQHEPVAEIDLSLSILRSVSPVHRAYMRNMGTACSMSVSILIEGKLWGLVSCHHHTPLYVPLRLRSACDLVMQVVSAQIESQASAQHLEWVLHARALQSRLLSAMAATDNYVDGLLANSALLLALLQADGVALVQGTSVHLFGGTPSESEVLQLADWLARRGEDVYASSHFSREYPEALSFASTASGVVAASLSKIHTTYLLWFRAEQLATVRWAGDPHKPALPPGEAPPAPGVTVSPRHSFEEWTQRVHACSALWTPEQIAAAAELRSAVLEIVLKHAEEMAGLAADLKVANAELEAFSYSISHDLRAPFRHISGFAELLREHDLERLSTKGHGYLKTIMESAHFAGVLVDSLLDFSRIGRIRLLKVPIAMNQLVDEEWQAVVDDDGGDRLIEFSRGDLPEVLGDPALLRQVLRNLFANAVKYTGKVERARITLTACREPLEYIFAVQDNGAGFDPQYAAKLFGVFQRLHRAEDFEGTGIGLANVRRIIARHGGRTWAESTPEHGATFFFSMPVQPIEERDLPRG